MEKEPNLTDLIKEAEKEERQKKALYPRWVELGKMSAKVAAWRLKCQRAIIENLKNQLPKNLSLFGE